MNKIGTALTTLLVFSLILLIHSPGFSQVTNLTVNGDTAGFTMTSGDVVTWSYNLPAGETAIGEIWFDLNANHAVDPGTDRRLFIFDQTDGDTSDNGGPPDMDGLVNGEIQVSVPVGLAPQNYLIKFTNGGVGETVWGSVLPLASPAYTISGTVTGPPGVDLRYLVVEASSDNGATEAFWQAVTDSMGLYTIELNSDTAGNPWRVRINEPPPPYSVFPAETSLTIDMSYTGIDFMLLAAAAQVRGQLLDDTGDSLAFRDMYISRDDTTGSNVYHGLQTDASGYFWFGIPAVELNGRPWNIAQPYNDNSPLTTHMLARGTLPVISDGDSLVRNLVSYTVNSSIEGSVRLNGLDPNFPLLIFATNQDTAEAFVWADSATGAFSIPVSDKIWEYQVSARYFSGGYDYPLVLAHAGDTGVIYNITTTGVNEGAGEIPSGFALGQNYPNPFNPVTTIRYSIPTRGPVVLTVYDVLGREVATLVNEVQEAGAKVVTFDAAGLPSGVYGYRMTSGSFSQVRKMLVLK